MVGVSWCRARNKRSSLDVGGVVLCLVEGARASREGCIDCLQLVRRGTFSLSGNRMDRVGRDEVRRYRVQEGYLTGMREKRKIRKKDGET